MEKFTTKEKIALGIIGLIVLAIFIQVAAHLDLFTRAFSGVEAKPIPGVEPGRNLLAAEGVVVTASSHNNDRETADRVRDGNPSSFWHVNLEQVGQPASLIVDFGEANPRSVRALAAKPRSDLPRQFLRKATLSGSNDGEDWDNLADILLLDPPADSGWLQWDLDNDRGYRFYRLQIDQGHEDGSRFNFYSLAELALLD